MLGYQCTTHTDQSQFFPPTGHYRFAVLSADTMNVSCCPIRLPSQDYRHTYMVLNYESTSQ